eukprot:6443087-Amphidinium_carterae.1
MALCRDIRFTDRNSGAALIKRQLRRGELLLMFSFLSRFNTLDLWNCWVPSPKGKRPNYFGLIDDDHLVPMWGASHPQCQMGTTTTTTTTTTTYEGLRCMTFTKELPSV